MIWYGFQADVVKSNISSKLLCEGLNGSNKYEISVEESHDLPESHSVLMLDYARDNIFERSIKLKNITNEFFKISLVSDWKISEKDMYVALDKNGCEISLQVEELRRLQRYVDSGYHKASKQGEKISAKGVSECSSVFIGIPYEVDEMQVEYVAKCSFVHVANSNMYIRGHADRINWLSLNGVGTVIVPSFGSGDKSRYDSAVLLLGDQLENIIFPKKTWSPGHIKLSDGRWYRLGEGISYYKNHDLQEQNNKVSKFFEQLDPLMEKINITVWKYDNITRVKSDVSRGILPFEKINPTKYYDDYLTRIIPVENNKIAIWSGKNYYTVAKFKDGDDLETIRDVFYDMWKYGYILTDYGKYLHQDQFTYIPKREIKSYMHLTYGDVKVLNEKRFWRF